MKRSIAPSALLALGLGAAAAVFLYVTSDVSKILAALAVAGWGIVAVVFAHVPATAAATAGWRTVLPAGSPPLERLLLFRWIKEAVNSLLPVAQVGGDVVRTRLLIQRGVEPSAAIAGSVVDVAIGTASLFVYLLLGLGGLVLAPQKGVTGALVLRAMAMAAPLVLLAVAAPRLGLIRLIDGAITRLGRRAAAAEGQDDTGLHDVIVGLYRRPWAVGSCLAWHLAAWGFGAAEAYVTLTILDLQPSWTQAFLVDSLGQGFRAAGFLIPGALGVQEGGFIVVFAMFGLPADQALAFSTLRRLREIILGLPGLFAWAGAEAAARRVA
ncbi:MAG TPA: lysylphosphatidylglycerol synthase domain-containing protein [Phenylobacterium sp.]